MREERTQKGSAAAVLYRGLCHIPWAPQSDTSSAWHFHHVVTARKNYARKTCSFLEKFIFVRIHNRARLQAALSRVLKGGKSERNAAVENSFGMTEAIRLSFTWQKKKKKKCHLVTYYVVPFPLPSALPCTSKACWWRGKVKWPLFSAETQPCP